VRRLARLLPHPLLSLGLALMWLLLNAPVTPGTGLLALAVGLLVPLSLRALRPEPLRVRAPRALLVLAGRVAADVVQSNIAVGRVILGLRPGERRSGFVHVPLAITSPAGLTALAIVLTSAPGTLWVQHDPRTGRLLLHVLDLDEADWPARIKARYEDLLLEIFP
jgi:multicomponent K+:H+ antiporter subunit E